jgi:PadR family transcriptional regulator
MTVAHCTAPRDRTATTVRVDWLSRQRQSNALTEDQCGELRYYVLHSTVQSVDVTQLLKGVLDLAVLRVLRDDDCYGYDVLRRLRGAGLDEVGDASVYGTLRRLFQAGYLTTYVVPSGEGPHRKYYALNPAGREQLDRSVKIWRAFATTMDQLIGKGASA